MYYDIVLDALIYISIVVLVMVLRNSESMQLLRLTEAKVMSFNFSSAVCSTPASSVAKGISLDLSSIRRSDRKKTAEEDEEAARTRARRELFKPAMQAFLGEEEYVLKLKRKPKLQPLRQKRLRL